MVKSIPATSYLDFINACFASSGISKKDNEAYTESVENDVKVCKLGSILLVDSGAAHTSVNYYFDLSNIWKTKETWIQYADGGIGKEISSKGNFMLHRHMIPAFVSPDLSENLLSIP